MIYYDEVAPFGPKEWAAFRAFHAGTVHGGTVSGGKEEELRKEIEHYPGGGGRILHVRRAKPSAQKCAWCYRPATKLCDAPRPSDPGKTCDKPLCSIHAMPGSKRPDTDFCPDHRSLSHL
jgi:hypothetical protein